MSVTSWKVSFDGVEGSGKGVISDLSSVREVGVSLSLEVADSTCEVEEDASPPSVAEVELDGPEIVLTTVVKTLVLVWV
jgi:hypothetical protein